MNPEIGSLQEGAAAMGLEVTATAAERFDRYLNELVRWRARLNLTAVRTAREIVRRHFLDSILAAAAVPMRIGASTVDVGSGAGFPGIPVKIVRPDLEVVLVESSRRRVAFLEHLAQVLDMPGLRVVWGRAEELAHRQAYREAFDYAVERATSRPAVSVELCLPFVRVGGAAVLLKASCAAEDIRQRYELVRALGGDVDTAALEESMGLPGGDRRRIAIVLKKVGQTPERFPRRAHRIGREP